MERKYKVYIQGYTSNQASREVTQFKAQDQLIQVCISGGKHTFKKKWHEGVYRETKRDGNGCQSANLRWHIKRE